MHIKTLQYTRQLLLQQHNKVAGNTLHSVFIKDVCCTQPHMLHATCCMQPVAQSRPAVYSGQLCYHKTSKVCCLLHATIFLWHTLARQFVACNCCVQQSFLCIPSFTCTCKFGRIGCLQMQIQVVQCIDTVDLHCTHSLQYSSKQLLMVLIMRRIMCFVVL